MDITTLIIELIAGAAGGNIIGQVLKDYSMGTTGNSIAGAVGGLIGGWILSAMTSAPVADAAAVAGSMGMGDIIQGIAGGGIGGAVLTAIAGVIRKQMNK